jgi:nucleoside-diphosphate-sugar epimerase
MIEHLSAMPVAPSRVIVVGGTGFIGTALLARLKADDVAAISLGSKDIDLTAPGSVDLLVDFLRPDDVVVMLSCITPDRHRGIDAVMQNLLMGKHVHCALSARPCSYLVYVSSDAVYPVNVDIIDETTLAEPITLYGGMHIVREVLFTESNTVPCGVIRSSMAYGESNPHDMYGPGRFIAEAMRHGTISLVGNGEELRDHINVTDLAELIVRMIMHRSIGKVIAATGQSISFLKLARLIEGLWDAPIKILSIPRQRAVFHRHFDIGDTLRAFPDMTFCTITDGLRRLRTKDPGSCDVERYGG